MLTISGLSISYGPVQVVHGVTMNVDEGQIVALIGPNGAGKSSVLRAVSGLIRPNAGDITFLGASLVGAPAHEIAMAGIAHVMEGRHLFGGLNVEDNLILAGSRDEKGNAGNLESVYQRWPRLRERREQLAGNLSGGEQQMLAIGRALMSRPRLMILDEPSWGLAPRIVRELMETFDKLRQGGMTILLCEQMANLALKICDYAYVMTSGKVVIEGSSQKLLADPNLQATYLGGEMGGVTPAPLKPRQMVVATEAVQVKKTPIDQSAARVKSNWANIEKVRRERARELQVGTGGLGDLAPNPKSLNREDRNKDAYAARERRRQMKVQEFEEDKKRSDIKHELTNLRKEISKLGAPRTGVEAEKPQVARTSEPSGAGRKTMEAIRKSQQTGSENSNLATAPIASETLQSDKARVDQERARREREAAARRQLRLQEVDPEHSANRDRQEVWPHAFTKADTWSRKNRKQLEEQRSRRQSIQLGETTNPEATGKPAFGKRIHKKQDRKLKELHRRQKQARGAGVNEKNQN